jgi:hypothetical protein
MADEPRKSRKWNAPLCLRGTPALRGGVEQRIAEEDSVQACEQTRRQRGGRVWSPAHDRSSDRRDGQAASGAFIHSLLRLAGLWAEKLRVGGHGRSANMSHGFSFIIMPKTDAEGRKSNSLLRLRWARLSLQRRERAIGQKSVRHRSANLSTRPFRPPLCGAGNGIPDCGWRSQKC